MKYLFLLFFWLCFVHAGYSQIQDMEEFQRKRIEYYCTTDLTSVKELIDHELTLLEEAELNYSPETYLAIENSLVVEKLNFLPYDSNTQRKAFLALSNQNLKNQLFMEGKKLRKLSPHYLASVADIKSRLLPFLTGTKLYRESADARELYTTALTQDKKNFSALLGYGCWLFFAPPIAGGGQLSGLKKIIEAEKAAGNPVEQYRALLYKSQMLWAMDRHQEAAAALTQAGTLIPGEQLTKYVEELNEQGISLFD